MAQHTPGPWQLHGKGDCPCGTIFDATGDCYVARAFGPADINDCDPIPNEAAQIANAALIAAAPDLLAALKNALHHIDIIAPGSHDVLKHGIRAAIARATASPKPE